MFGRELREAQEACRRWRMYADPSELDKAWDIYYGVCGFSIVFIVPSFLVLQVFRKVEKQLPQLTTLDLQYVSPSLLKARNLDLAVPGNTRFFLRVQLC